VRLFHLTLGQGDTKKVLIRFWGKKIFSSPAQINLKEPFFF